MDDVEARRTHRQGALSFDNAPRPCEELYDIVNDPDQLVNLATEPKFSSVVTSLRARVEQVMNNSNDPRIKDAFDRLPWVDSTKP